MYSNTVFDKYSEHLNQYSSLRVSLASYAEFLRSRAQSQLDFYQDAMNAADSVETIASEYEGSLLSIPCTIGADTAFGGVEYANLVHALEDETAVIDVNFLTADGANVIRQIPAKDIISSIDSTIRSSNITAECCSYISACSDSFEVSAANLVTHLQLSGLSDISYADSDFIQLLSNGPMKVKTLLSAWCDRFSALTSGSNTYLYSFSAESYSSTNSLLLALGVIGKGISSFFADIKFSIDKVGEFFAGVGKAIGKAFTWVISKLFPNLESDYEINSDAVDGGVDIPVMSGVIYEADLVKPYSFGMAGILSMARSYDAFDAKGCFFVDADLFGSILNGVYVASLLSGYAWSKVIPIEFGYLMFQFSGNKNDGIQWFIFLGDHDNSYYSNTEDSAGYVYNMTSCDRVLTPESNTSKSVAAWIRSRLELMQDVLGIYNGITSSSYGVSAESADNNAGALVNLVSPWLNLRVFDDVRFVNGSYVKQSHTSPETCQCSALYGYILAHLCMCRSESRKQLLQKGVSFGGLTRNRSVDGNVVLQYNPSTLVTMNSADIEAINELYYPVADNYQLSASIHVQSDAERAKEVLTTIARIAGAVLAVFVAVKLVKIRKKAQLKRQSLQSYVDAAEWNLTEHPGDPALLQSWWKAQKKLSKFDRKVKFLGIVAEKTVDNMSFTPASEIGSIVEGLGNSTSYTASDMSRLGKLISNRF